MVADTISLYHAVYLEKPASEGAGVGLKGPQVLDVTLPWPLTFVVQDIHLQHCNCIFAVLLQVLAPRSSCCTACLCLRYTVAVLGVQLVHLCAGACGT